MGKAATYRKRGTSIATILNTVPPAPQSILFEGHFLTIPTDDDDDGGNFHYYYSPTPPPPADPQDGDAWSTGGSDWGDYGLWPPGYYYSTEVGNNVNYFGESNPSNIIQLPERT